MNYRVTPCPDCDGRGHINGGDEHSTWSRTCALCHGTGVAKIPKTNADQIRDMKDEELAAYWANHYDDFCQSKPECGDLLNDNKCIPDHWCIACALEWLQKPMEELLPPPNIFEDKQESGLIEEE